MGLSATSTLAAASSVQDFDVEVELLEASLARRAAGKGHNARRRREDRRHVDWRLLHVPVPEPELLRQALEVKALLASASAEPTDAETDSDSTDEERRGLARSSKWERLLRHARETYGPKVCEELGGNTDLQPLYPDRAVRSNFFRACRSHKHSVSIGYHGTKAKNIPSILKVGLLVPGNDDNNIKVEHGSAHGVGVYPAHLGSASLSRTFTDSGTLLVCAICDTSKECEPGYDRFKPLRFVPSSTHVMTTFPPRTGRTGSQRSLACKRVSDQVLHVGDAMVIFDEHFVVPLFTATPQPDKGPGTVAAPTAEPVWEQPQQVGKRRVAVPEEGNTRVVFPRPGVTRVGRTVWLPPMPLLAAKGSEKAVKRRLVQRCWQNQRRAARQAKRAEWDSTAVSLAL
mmetsp:Transcript_64350/g.188295  ORF Transcript_64350/g.188295 Transcript_64350/m.188295 type:complete len:400 (+) Transcript_64350:59-1258(+)